MDTGFDKRFEPIGLEVLAQQIRDLENDEFVLLARKADSARSLLAKRVIELSKEKKRGLALELQGLTHEYLDSILEGRE